MIQGPLFFGTNWKMHKTVGEATDYAERLRTRLGQLDRRACVFVIPSYISIDAVRRAACGAFWVGAQNMHWAEWGAYTGEVSAPMLKDVGADLVELGHAERRQHFNESDAAINRKVHAALRFGLRPLVCIGEDADDKHYGVEQETVSRQVRIALHGIDPKLADRTLLAYEPWWAIGDGGTTADADYVRRMIHAIRAALWSVVGETAASVPVLYGGGVLEKDAPHLLFRGGADGLFIGRAALDPDAFADVVISCLRAAPVQSARGEN